MPLPGRRDVTLLLTLLDQAADWYARRWDDLDQWDRTGRQL
jgi:hypothetical protein